MHKSKLTCSTCALVNTLCFWGDIPAKKWKRPALAILSIVILSGGGYLFSTSWSSTLQSPIVLLLTLVLVVLFTFSLILSIIGCDKCVAKIFGKIDIT